MLSQDLTILPRVTIQELEGTAYTVEIMAESLYEAVAQGLAALRRSDWVHEFQQGVVKVSVADVCVELQVKLADFTQWLEKPGAKSPREMISAAAVAINTRNACPCG